MRGLAFVLDVARPMPLELMRQVLETRWNRLLWIKEAAQPFVLAFLTGQ
jgi:hypothetical protein